MRDGEISKKHGNTTISTLRHTYGEGFAPGVNGNAKLATVSNRFQSCPPFRAQTIGREFTALEAFYRRLAGRVGRAKAVTATARKMAVLFYNTLRHGMDYSDPGASYYEGRYRRRVLSNLQRRAKSLGFVLQAVEPEPGSAGVS